MKIKKPLPSWAKQLVWFVYGAVFTGAGATYAHTGDTAVASNVTILAPVIHGLLVLLVGENPNEKH